MCKPSPPDTRGSCVIDDVEGVGSGGDINISLRFKTPEWSEAGGVDGHGSGDGMVISSPLLERLVVLTVFR